MHTVGLATIHLPIPCNLLPDPIYVCARRLSGSIINQRVSEPRQLARMHPELYNLRTLSLLVRFRRSIELYATIR